LARPLRSFIYFFIYLFIYLSSSKFVSFSLFHIRPPNTTVLGQVLCLFWLLGRRSISERARAHAHSAEFESRELRFLFFAHKKPSHCLELSNFWPDFCQNLPGFCQNLPDFCQNFARRPSGTPPKVTSLKLDTEEEDEFEESQQSWCFAGGAKRRAEKIVGGERFFILLSHKLLLANNCSQNGQANNCGFGGQQSNDNLDILLYFICPLRVVLLQRFPPLLSFALLCSPPSSCLSLSLLLLCGLSE